MSVFFINNFGGGFASQVQVEPNTTIEKFLAQKLPDAAPDGLLIRVNRLPVARNHVLQEGDRVSATPTKIEGARPLAA